MKKLFLFIIPLLLISACKKETETTKETIRAVKTLTIREAARANNRQISGAVKSANESALSFRVGGRVANVNVKIGDKITKGQTLATLEKKEYTLALQSARAKLASARADLIEKSDALQRQKKLKEKDFASQAAVDQAQAAFSAAQSSVNVAQSALENAQEDIDNTVLKAPFDGAIASRSIDPFTEIMAGETVFEMQGEGAMEVEVLMPETLISDISRGDLVSVTFPTLKNVTLNGSISKIGARAENGNAFPLTIKLDQSSDDIRSGMTAQVTFNFGEDSADSVFIIPVSALDLRIPVEETTVENRQVPVFIVSNGIARERVITVRDIRGNDLEVIDGLKTGDVLITAGVPFIQDGQPVKQWEPTYNDPAIIQQ